MDDLLRVDSSPLTRKAYRIRFVSLDVPKVPVIAYVKRYLSPLEALFYFRHVAESWLELGPKKDLDPRVVKETLETVLEARRAWMDRLFQALSRLDVVIFYSYEEAPPGTADFLQAMLCGTSPDLIVQVPFYTNSACGEPILAALTDFGIASCFAVAHISLRQEILKASAPWTEHAPKGVFIPYPGVTSFFRMDLENRIEFSRYEMFGIPYVSLEPERLAEALVSCPSELFADAAYFRAEEKKDPLAVEYEIGEDVAVEQGGCPC